MCTIKEDSLMLRKFSVKNFKNFNKEVVLQLDHPANYEFNREIVRNNCITKGIVYGINGSGKSNLALAIFDIILHLTDKERALDKYQLYQNLASGKKEVEFEYVFEFGGKEVVYRYTKTAPLTLVCESVLIDTVEVLHYDYLQKDGFSKLPGTENLQLSSPSLTGANQLSRVKFVKSNALLVDTPENRAFRSFVDFVDNMLMFYSLTQNRYQGFDVGVDSFTRGIINAGKIKDFEVFLRNQGIDYTLVSLDLNGQSELFCQFPDVPPVPFVTIASTGTLSLALFYYWYIRMEKASFVYIDEYDAFYHFELAQELVKLVKQLSNTQVLLSTHNTDLISNDLLRPDAYYIIKDNAIRSFDKISNKELRRAHNIQKMYKAGEFDE